MTPSDSPRVILCVDDDIMGLSMRRLMLQSQGYRVLTASSGREGISILSQEHVDLVLLDYYMPEMNGDVVAREMKRLSPALPIVLLSAYVELPSEVLSLVDRSMTKGDDPAFLLATITELLHPKFVNKATPAA